MTTCIGIQSKDSVHLCVDSRLTGMNYIGSETTQKAFSVGKNYICFSGYADVTHLVKRVLIQIQAGGFNSIEAFSALGIKENSFEYHSLMYFLDLDRKQSRDFSEEALNFEGLSLFWKMLTLAVKHNTCVLGSESECSVDTYADCLIATPHGLFHITSDGSVAKGRLLGIGSGSRIAIGAVLGSLEQVGTETNIEAFLTGALDKYHDIPFLLSNAVRATSLLDPNTNANAKTYQIKLEV